MCDSQELNLARDSIAIADSAQQISISSMQQLCRILIDSIPSATGKVEEWPNALVLKIRSLSVAEPAKHAI
jgi:hypothetical protein